MSFIADRVYSFSLGRLPTNQQRKAVYMLIFNYASKKEMKEAIGERLLYIETSMFGDQYKPDGKLVGCNRPHLTGHKREFFAEVTMENGIIKKVS